MSRQLNVKIGSPVHTKYRAPFLFIAIGSMNTAIDIGLYLLLRKFGTEVWIANIISTSIALSFSYTMNSKYTFRSATNPRNNIVPFLFVSLTGLWVLQPTIIYLSADILRSDLLSKLAATSMTLIWNYVLYSKVVFKR